MVALMLSHFSDEKHEFVAANGQLPLIQDLASLVANFTVSDTKGSQQHYSCVFAKNTSVSRKWSTF